MLQRIRIIKDTNPSKIRFALKIGKINREEALYYLLERRKMLFVNIKDKENTNYDKLNSLLVNKKMEEIYWKIETWKNFNKDKKEKD